MKAIEGKTGLFFVLWLLLLTSGTASHAATLPLEDHPFSEETLSESYPHQYHFEQIEILSVPQAAQDELPEFRTMPNPDRAFAVLSDLAARKHFPSQKDLRHFLKIHIYPFHCFW